MPEVVLVEGACVVGRGVAAEVADLPRSPKLSDVPIAEVDDGAVVLVVF